MQVYNEQKDAELQDELKDTLSLLRDARGFHAGRYIEAKGALLNDYMKKSGLKSCVIGISGGIDSALVLALIVAASKQKDSPIERIVPLVMPIFTGGATNQDYAADRAIELIKSLGLNEKFAELTDAQSVMKATIDKALDIKGDQWAEGQLVSYIRAPALYYTTSLLSQEGTPAVVMGTTNRDEGAYLGFIGKASDAMVDIQLISDIHKSEVYETSRALNVPQSILDAIPTGDMYDARVDTEVFGAPYDFVEIYLALKCVPSDIREAMIEAWSSVAKGQFDLLSSRLDNLHNYNAHKYKVGSPAVHLDIYPSAVPGGWQYGPKDKPWLEISDTTSFVSLFDLSQQTIDVVKQDKTYRPSSEIIPFVDSGQNLHATLINQLLKKDEVQTLYKEIEQQKWLPAGMDGKRDNFDKDTDKTGSLRATCYSEELSENLWRRLSGHIEMVEYIASDTSIDANDAVVWRAVGVNPLFRFIKYTGDGALIPHYDAPYDYGDGRRTLKSFIVYLTDNQKEGTTRFIKDPQMTKLALERDYSDWTQTANAEDVLCEVQSNIGQGLVFNHRVLHDSKALTGIDNVKIIMRTDVIYEKVSL